MTSSYKTIAPMIFHAAVNIRLLQPKVAFLISNSFNRNLLVINERLTDELGAIIKFPALALRFARRLSHL